MKNFLFLLLSVLVFSCSDDSVNEKTNLSMGRVSEVIKETNLENQKLMYTLLNEKEKYQLWINKIDFLISDNKMSEDQVDLLKELKNNLSEDLFNDKAFNDQREVFKNIYVKEFLNKSVNIFTEEFILDNFYNISSKYEHIAEPGDGELPSCTCNRGSMWSCSGSFECKDTNKCKDTSSGCGFLMFFECNGRCFLY